MQALKYSRGSLQVLDQLLLPHQEVFIDVKTTQDTWSVIRLMQVRGAPLIAIVAALGLGVEAFNKKFESVEDAADFLLKSIEYLRTSRPTAVNLFIAMDELTTLVNDQKNKSSQSAEGLILAYVQAAETLYEEDVKTNKLIGKHGAEKILEIVRKDKVRILTICNTGSLATAGYGTALGVVRALHETGHLEHIYACETRPYNQGARLTSFEIVSDNLPGTLITDSMASALMTLKGVDAVIVGADRVTANGDTANKIGTYQLAIAAQYHKIPFFAAVPTTTIDLTKACGTEIHIEERPADELTTIFGQRIAPEGINVWNPGFDVTPCSLIRGIITELGVIEPEIRGVEGVSKNSDSVIPVASFLQSKLQSIAQERELSVYYKELLVRIQSAVIPIATPIGYERMDTERLIPYLLTQGRLLKILGVDTTTVHTSEQLRQVLDVKEVSDGNLNFVYIISHNHGDDNSYHMIIKQALPYVRCVGENWPLTLQRASFEYQALEAHSIATSHHYVPEVYLFDNINCLIAMRYIEPPHLILRKQLIARNKLSTMAHDLGYFLAHTLFKSSGLYLTGGELRKNVTTWSGNIALCALTEKVIFTDPYTAGCPLNRWTKPQLDDFAQGITQDKALKVAASHWKQVFVTSTQALLHGDLHTGSVMAKEGSTFVIDPEFAFYGPMGFDLGALFSNLYLAYFSHSVARQSGDADTGSEEYRDWVLAQIEVVFATFTREFTTLWDEYAGQRGEFYPSAIYSSAEQSAARDQFLHNVFIDTLGFAGMKMIRRIVGIAHVEDLESITDDAVRATAERRALLFARTLVISAHRRSVAIDKLDSFTAVNQLAKRLATVDSHSKQWPSETTSWSDFLQNL